MPYIDPELRDNIDPYINPICACGWEKPGELVYILTRIALCKSPDSFTDATVVLDGSDHSYREVREVGAEDAERGPGGYLGEWWDGADKKQRLEVIRIG